MRGKLLKYETVKEVIESDGDVLVSKAYVNSKTLLWISCKKCGQEYEQTYKRYREGRRHNKCPMVVNPLIEYNEKRKVIHPIETCRTCGKKFVAYRKGQIFCERACYRNKEKMQYINTCGMCKKEFSAKRKKQIHCSKECNYKALKIRVKTKEFKETSRKGGLKSAQVQSRRSKNEVLFAELVSSLFDITTNEPFFDKWDADIIIHELKIAISWNGIWHYQQVRESHSLKQVQSRDRIKDKIIKKYGYLHYVIKDMGRRNKKFVKEEFKKFCQYLWYREHIELNED